MSVLSRLFAVFSFVVVAARLVDFLVALLLDASVAFRPCFRQHPSGNWKLGVPPQQAVSGWWLALSGGLFVCARLVSC